MSLHTFQCQSTSALVLSFQYVQCQSTSALVPKTWFQFWAIVMLWEWGTRKTKLRRGAASSETEFREEEMLKKHLKWILN
jgi:hypothetical protein